MTKLLALLPAIALASACASAPQRQAPLLTFEVTETDRCRWQVMREAADVQPVRELIDLCLRGEGDLYAQRLARHNRFVRLRRSAEGRLRSSPEAQLLINQTAELLEEAAAGNVPESACATGTWCASPPRDELSAPVLNEIEREIDHEGGGVPRAEELPAEREREPASASSAELDSASEND